MSGPSRKTISDINDITFLNFNREERPWKVTGSYFKHDLETYNLAMNSVITGEPITYQEYLNENKQLKSMTFHSVSGGIIFKTNINDTSKFLENVEMEKDLHVKRRATINDVLFNHIRIEKILAGTFDVCYTFIDFSYTPTEQKIIYTASNNIFSYITSTSGEIDFIKNNVATINEISNNEIVFNTENVIIYNTLSNEILINRELYNTNSYIKEADISDINLYNINSACTFYEDISTNKTIHNNKIINNLLESKESNIKKADISDVNLYNINTACTFYEDISTNKTIYNDKIINNLLESKESNIEKADISNVNIYNINNDLVTINNDLNVKGITYNNHIITNSIETQKINIEDADISNINIENVTSSNINFNDINVNGTLFVNALDININRTTGLINGDLNIERILNDISRNIVGGRFHNSIIGYDLDDSVDATKAAFSDLLVNSKLNIITNEKNKIQITSSEKNTLDNELLVIDKLENIENYDMNIYNHNDKKIRLYSGDNQIKIFIPKELPDDLYYLSRNGCGNLVVKFDKPLNSMQHYYLINNKLENTKIEMIKDSNYMEYTCGQLEDRPLLKDKSYNLFMKNVYNLPSIEKFSLYIRQQNDLFIDPIIIETNNSNNFMEIIKNYKTSWKNSINLNKIELNNNETKSELKFNSDNNKNSISLLGPSNNFNNSYSLKLPKNICEYNEILKIKGREKYVDNDPNKYYNNNSINKIIVDVKDDDVLIKLPSNNHLHNNLIYNYAKDIIVTENIPKNIGIRYHEGKVEIYYNSNNEFEVTQYKKYDINDNIFTNSFRIYLNENINIENCVLGEDFKDLIMLPFTNINQIIILGNDMKALPIPKNKWTTIVTVYNSSNKIYNNLDFKNNINLNTSISIYDNEDIQYASSHRLDEYNKLEFIYDIFNVQEDLSKRGIKGFGIKFKNPLTDYQHNILINNKFDDISLKEIRYNNITNKTLYECYNLDNVILYQNNIYRLFNNSTINNLPAVENFEVFLRKEDLIFNDITILNSKNEDDYNNIEQMNVFETFWQKEIISLEDYNNLLNRIEALENK